MELGNLASYILVGQPEVDAGSVNVPVTKLLLKGIKAATTVQEIDCVAVAKQMGMHLTLQACQLSRGLDYLVRSLFGDVSSLPGREKEIVPVHTLLLGPKQNTSNKAILDEHDPLSAPLSEDPDAITRHIP